MSDTPRTDDEEYTTTLPRKDVVDAEFARTLERENSAMREAIKEAHEHLCSVGSGRGCLLSFDLDDAMPDIEAALAKLQTFIQ